jgi:hypothetical protein
MMGELDDLPFDWEDDYPYNDDERPPVQCRLCGSTNVFWQQNQQTGKWELRDFSRGVAGKRHVCKARDRDAYIDDIFDDLT